MLTDDPHDSFVTSVTSTPYPEKPRQHCVICETPLPDMGAFEMVVPLCTAHNQSFWVYLVEDYKKSLLRQLQDSGGGIRNFPDGLSLKCTAHPEPLTDLKLELDNDISPDALEIIEIDLPGVLWLATLHDTHTGEIKVIREMFPNGFPHNSVEFIWNQGNFGCDCNRYDMFYPDDDVVNWPCNTTEQRFVLLKLEKVKDANP